MYVGYDKLKIIQSFTQFFNADINFLIDYLYVISSETFIYHTTPKNNMLKHETRKFLSQDFYLLSNSSSKL